MDNLTDISQLTSEIYNNSKALVVDPLANKFYFKLLILFCIYLFSNYIFDLIDHDNLSQTFQSSPYINLKLPKNTTFQLLITLLMIIISHYVYKLLIKPVLNHQKN
jgi:hypothetical protein